MKKAPQALAVLGTTLLLILMNSCGVKGDPVPYVQAYPDAVEEGPNSNEGKSK